MKLFTGPLLALFIGTLGAAEPATPSQNGAVSSDVVTRGSVPKGLPDQPGWGFWPNCPAAWMQTHERFLACTKKGGIDLIFLGDSIVAGWKAATTENWAGSVPSLKAVNYGIGGDSTRQLLWRIDQGTLDGLTPKLVVLMIGTNNLYADQNSGSNEEIAQGVARVTERIQAKLPQSRVLLLGVLPRQTQPWCKRIETLNEMIARTAAAATHVRYLDLSAIFSDPSGQADRRFYQADTVHLNAPGYERLNAAVLPVIADLLK